MNDMPRQQRNDLFITGEWLRDRFTQLERKATDATMGAVRLEEFIAVPAFGQIMMRFQTDMPVTVDKVDLWEQLLREKAGDEFMVDFMGSIYRQIGVDLSRLDEINEKLAKRFADEPMISGPYADQIRQDAKELLRRCDLPGELPVWEIQYEEGEYSLLLLGRENRFIRTVRGETTIHVLEANGTLCKGLQKAVFAARRRGVSLGRLMLEAMEE